jgi:hypothetical protein
MRRIYILAYINAEQIALRKPIQAKITQYWLDKNYEVHVLDSVFTQQEYDAFMPQSAIRHSDEKFRHISYARNWAINHASADGVNDFIAIADNDCTLRDMSDYDLDTEDLLTALHCSDADVVFASPPTSFIKEFFNTNEYSNTHLVLTSENTFKGSLLWVHTKTKHRFDEWYDQPYKHFPITPGEDGDFGLRGKMDGYKIRLAKQLIQHEHGGVKSSNWCTNTHERGDKPWLQRLDINNMISFNNNYNHQYGKRDLIKLPNVYLPSDALFS